MNFAKCRAETRLKESYRWLWCIEKRTKGLLPWHVNGSVSGEFNASCDDRKHMKCTRDRQGEMLAAIDIRGEKRERRVLRYVASSRYVLEQTSHNFAVQPHQFAKQINVGCQIPL